MVNMYQVGTRVVHKQGEGTVVEVDYDDSFLPYRISFDRDGALLWVYVAEIEKIENNTLYTITEKDLEGILVELSDTNWYRAGSCLVKQDETPEAARAWAKQHIMCAAQYEALARHLEDNAVDPRFNEVAQTIYEKDYEGLAPSFKTVVDRVVSNFYGIENNR